VKAFTPSQQTLLLLIAALAVVVHAARIHRGTVIPDPSNLAAKRRCITSSDLRQQLLLGVPISINQAAAEDLRLIPGISTTLGQRIVAYRKHHGLYQRWSQLLNVHGIGPKTLEKLRPYVTLDGRSSDLKAERASNS
jgi:competence ComEA-like helix-hairpin-helix protein